MGSLESMKGDKIHSRNIRVETFKAGEDRIIVEGTLNDERMVGSRTLAGKAVKPGKFHGMVVRFLVGETPPRILDVEAQMFKTPSDSCCQAESTMDSLIGLPIVYGYSKEIKDRLGGTKSCTHLMSLVLVMGSAAIQGFATNRGHRNVEPGARDILFQYVKNSCLMWGEDGEFYKRTMKEIEAGKGVGQDGS